MTKQIHLIDLLAKAHKDAPGPTHVAVQPMTLNRDSRMAVFQHPPATVTFESIRLGSKPSLSLACGIKQFCWDRIATHILFEIRIREATGTEQTIFSFKLDPKRDSSHRKWMEHTVDLNAFAGKSVTLTLCTSVPRKAPASYCWSGWADLCISHEVAETPRRKPKQQRPHIILITTDALRADLLGCYGNREVMTPNLDQFAKDGILLKHARVQSTVTLGSYASMLTGRHLPGHGIVAEWGELPAHVLNLPTYLSGQGYHTLIATSEAELGEPGPGFTRVFKEQIPCLAQPAQEGGVTSRQFIHWLDRMPEAPCFAWLQFFDTHPPQIPPEPFKSQYYPGNPADPKNAFQPEALAQVRGMEAVQEIMTALPMLKAGIVEDALRLRLRDTINFLQRKISSGPDLAAHLAALGPKSWGTKSLTEFTAWLEKQVDALDQDRVLPDLVPWLEKVLVMVRDIEADILSWLDGVVDYRFPVSQHKASVSYLDHLVGRVVSELKERDLYDSSTIIFTSPHGELFGEHEVYFHHHLMLEPILRVPMIIKPAKGTQWKGYEVPTGKQVGGIFDSIDLFPTILDIQGLPIPSNLDGKSRWREMVQEEAITEHDSVSLDQHGIAYSLVSGHFKYMEVMGNHELSRQWSWKRGDRALFDLSSPTGETSNVIQKHPDIAAELAARLKTWKQCIK